VSERDQARVSRKEAGTLRGLIVGDARDVAAALAQHTQKQLLIFFRVRTRETCGCHHHGSAVGGQGSSMRCSVDAFRATRKDGDSRRSQLSRQLSREALAFRGRRAGTNDCN
jgi:hypothetical protein